MADNKYRELVSVARIDDILAEHAKAYKVTIGEIINRRWFYDAAKGQVAFILTIDETDQSGVVT